MGTRAWQALVGYCLWQGWLNLAQAQPSAPTTAPELPSSNAAPTTAVTSGPPAPSAPPAAQVPPSSSVSVGFDSAPVRTQDVTDSSSASPTATGATAVPVAPAPSHATAPPPASEGRASSVSNAAPSEQSALFEAEQAVLDVDYERSLMFAQRAISEGGLSLDELRRAHLALALSAAQLDRPDVALPAFLKLFALDPGVDFSKRLAPARRGAATAAQRHWQQYGHRFSLRTEFARDERKLKVFTGDPFSWIGRVSVWVRVPEGQFVRHDLPVAHPAELALDVGSLDVVEVYVRGLDAAGNVLIEAGTADQPIALTPGIEDTLDLQRDVRGGETGSVATHLADSEPTTTVNGFASLELGPTGDTRGATFDFRHATVYLRSQLARHALLELGVDAEHLAGAERELTLPHAYFDFEVREWLVLRPGFFEAPIGAFNEYSWPDFIRRTAMTPLFATVVVPGLWSELGLQARGRVAVAPQAHLTYAVFVSNGLEQPDAIVGDGEVAEGGDLMDMRYNVRDRYDANKAIGGRVGLQWGRFDVGASGYTGRYTIDAHRRLSIADVDVSYQSRLLTVRAEGAASFQDVTGGWRTKMGAYGLVSSRVAPHLEPYLQYDFLNDRKVVQHRALFGTSVYPFPSEPNARTLRLKAEVGVIGGPERDAAFVWLTQLVGGF